MTHLIRRLISALLVCLPLLLAGCGSTENAAKSPAASDGSSEVAITPDVGAADADAAVADVAADAAADAASPKGKSWNVLVYMAGDNNLEKSGVVDMTEMLGLPAADNLTFHVQTDRHESFYQLGVGDLGAWEGTKRVVIKSGKVQELTDLGEVNMGKPESLAAFVEWGTKVVKADRVMLVLWDHGHAWRGFGGDDFDKDELTLEEISTGIQTGMQKAGLEKFDLLGFDACLMGDLAVLRKVTPFAPWIVASEDLEPSHGWDYGSFQAVVDDGNISPEALGAQIVTGFKDQAKAEGKSHSITLALLESAKLAEVDKAFTAFVDAVHNGVLGDDGKPSPKAPLLLALEKARATAQSFGRSANPEQDYQMVDLVDLAAELAALDKGFKNHGDDLESAMGALVKKKVFGPLTKASNGLSLYFPSAKQYYESKFNDIKGFEKWREVLDALYGGGALAKGQAPGFESESCSGCVQGSNAVKPGCSTTGELTTVKKLKKETVQGAVKAEMLVGYEGSSGKVQAVAVVPAEIDVKTGDVSAKWSQEVLLAQQSGRTAILTAKSTIDGVEVIHEVPIKVAGPAACACTIPGDPGFADTDGDGIANCVDGDDDGDGKDDSADNCAFVPNLDQADGDKDGKGDACQSADNAPKTDCQPSATAPFGPERDGSLVVVTHRVKKTTVSYSFYVRAQGGVGEETLKGHHRIRPMVLQSTPKGWEWLPGDPLPMRPDMTIAFAFRPLEASWQSNANGTVKTDKDGKPLTLLKSIGAKDLFMQLLVTGVGGWSDGVYWKGQKEDEAMGACPPQDPVASLCPIGQVYDCNGTCWPEAKWGDGTCDAGQNGGADFFCEARAFDKGACAAPECPGGLGLVRDCDGKCIAKPEMKGDKSCQAGQSVAIPDLLCAQFQYDGGDCPCAVDCLGHGTCESNVCNCANGWTGPYCEIPPTCGNGTCEGQELCSNCAADCGTCATPGCGSCTAKTCGDGLCSAAQGENCSSCAKDCGACACGDGACSGSEDSATCPADCGSSPVCGDEVCQIWMPDSKFAKAKGERCDTCPGDCGACQGECCDASQGSAQSSSNTAYLGGGCSDGKVTQCVCGKDPSCCVFGWSAACVKIAETECALSCCKPSCGGKECGGDGCGGICGTCDDGKPCTTDSCGADGNCVYAPTPGPCDDGDPCTIASSCKDGTCVTGAPKCTDGDACFTQACKGGACVVASQKLCNDGNPCTDDACDPKTGCTATSNTASCDDGNVCTGADACKGGACAGGKLAVCDDANPCTDDSCDPAKGCVSLPNSASCTDNNVCTADDACKAGACLPGKASDCDDKEFCTLDTCDPGKGCVHSNTVEPCTDGSACTAPDLCKDGKCLAGPGTNCSDGNACTDDSCVATKGCASANNSATCSDGNPCTELDACSGGVCSAGGNKDCDDAKPCTLDACSAKDGCIHSNAAFSCDDGDSCTYGDVCQAGSCTAGKTVNCNDGNACTSDSCDPKTGCAALPNTATCTDGDGCTANDACSAGTCKGTAKVCAEDGDKCTVEACKDGVCSTSAKVCVGGACAASACEAATGDCKLAPKTDGTVCDDSDACTAGTTCAAGLCGTAVKCDDGKACTADSCDKVAGCKNVAIAEGASCDDADACTTGETCKGGACGTGKTLNCNDGNLCTSDSCQPAKGCVTTPAAPSAGTAVMGAVKIHVDRPAGFAATPQSNSKGEVYLANGNDKYFWRWQGKVSPTTGSGAALTWKTNNRMVVLVVRKDDKVFAIGDSDSEPKVQFWEVDDSNGNPKQALWFSPEGLVKRAEFNQDGDLYIMGNNTVYRVAFATGAVLATTGPSLAYPGPKAPYASWGLATQGKFVWTTSKTHINMWDENFNHLASTQVGTFLSCLAFDSKGQLYVLDTGTPGKIYALDSQLTGAPSLVSGLTGTAFSFDPSDNVVLQDGTSVLKTALLATSCTDGLACTTGDVCSAGTCKGVANCASGTSCVDDGKGGSCK